jgi:hypothetical protein
MIKLLSLRVNEMTVSEVSLRHPTRDGHIHPDEYEVEILDPKLGRFALTDDFIIEIRDAIDPPTWQTISLSELIALLSPR